MPEIGDPVGTVPVLIRSRGVDETIETMREIKFHEFIGVNTGSNTNATDVFDPDFANEWGIKGTL